MDGGSGIDGWQAAKALWGIVVTGLSVLGLRQMDRIDKLEESRVPKTDHEKEIERLRADHQRTSDELKTALREQRQETQAHFTRVFQRLDEIADRVAER